jgi:O-antigen/teichoic acid export membrane protein/2-polyprenyl-3-methyl-5-hydroxy-6-metoxy-1,4-benzoquinol methylase
MGLQFSTEVSKNKMVTDTASPEIIKEPSRLPRAKGKFVSNVLTLMTGNGLSQLINIAGTLVLARLFAPDAFGSFALFVTLVSFLSVLGGGRYELAIMLPEKDEEAANVLFLAVLVLTGVAGISLLLVALFHAPVARLLGDDRLNLWLWAAPLALFINGLYQVQGVWFGRMKRFRRVATARVFQSSGIVLGQLGLLVVHPGGFALVGGWIIGQSIGSFCLLSQLLYSDGRFLWQARDWALVREAVGRYRNFPMYKAPHSFISNASSQLVIVILRMFADLNLVGLYSMAARAVYLPVTLIASSMNEVFYEKAATELKYGHLERFVTRLLRIQLVLAAPLLVLVAYDAKLIFGFFLGPKWVAAGAFAAILAFLSFLYFLTSWLDRLFDVRGRQKICLILEVTGNVLSLGALALMLKWRPQDAPLAIGAYVVLQMIFTLIWLVFAYRVAEFGMKGLTLLLRDAVISLGLATLFVGTIHYFLHGWPAFLVSGAVALCMIAISFVRYVSTGTALSSTTERFRQFWAEQDTTLKGRDDEEFRRAQACELKNLFPKRMPGRVLEIGCGDGGLFPYLQIPVENYKGIDFSPQFIERFKSTYPEVELECTEGSSYLDRDTQYDVILMDAIVQHFDRPMLEQHLQNARRMITENGRLIWGSIPQRKHRGKYDAGKWSTDGRTSLARFIKSWVGRILGMDAMGYWYEPSEIAALARKYGFHARFVLSGASPYRFHAILQKKLVNAAEKREDLISAATAAMTRPS